MINRLFKTIFILSLCLGITLPSNAGSVQVSDGSAFITKSEMAYDLNNLSNRMAQLENSLDSKIDTLVSSYLTRNGIWNGAEQTYLITKNQYYTTTDESLSLSFVKPNKSGLLFTYVISNYKHALQCYPETTINPVSVVNGDANININVFSNNNLQNSVWSLTKVVTWAGQADIQDDNVTGTGINYNCADTKDIDYVDTCICFVNRDETYTLVVDVTQKTQIHWSDGSDLRKGLSWAAEPAGSKTRTVWNGSYNEGVKKYWGRGSYYTFQIGIGNELCVY